MYVNYRDLNRASPKDNFPLPHIDMLVDNIAQHAFYSFMDGFSRYNQIQMTIEDREKTTFITTLKNVRATYQRAMVTLFHDMMHKEVEVNVDDVITKSKTLDQHKMEWNEECQEAFEKVKQYLDAPLVLVPATPGKPLILYLTVLEESMGGVLGKQDALGKKEQAIYYISKKFIDCEQRLGQYMLTHTTWLTTKMDPLKYTFEKPALTGWIACWKMAFSEYDIVYTSQKAIKGSAMAEQLAHHPLDNYQPLLHEFLDEHIMAVEGAGFESEPVGWKLWFDGASNLLGNGIRVILASPKG
ncbi:hypothetical protein CR513_19467, partial [Mucuna pruriens]